MDSQIKRTNAAKTNVINAISFTQTQDGYLKKFAQALDRMSELTLRAQANQLPQSVLRLL